MDEKIQEALKKNYAIYQKEIEKAEEEYNDLIAQAVKIKQERIEQAQYVFFDTMEMIQEKIKV